jgi:branched-subunit amino acid transport protein
MQNYWKYLVVMAAVTYLLRALPFVLVKKKIENRYIRSFLEYIPYAILAAMTFPAVFTSAGALIPSLAGFAVALILAWRKRGLLTVALAAVAVAGLVTWIGVF